MPAGTVAPISCTPVTVSSEVARLERLAGAPNCSLTDAGDQSSPSAPPWPSRSSRGTFDEQQSLQRAVPETSASASQAVPPLHTALQRTARHTDETNSIVDRSKHPRMALQTREESGNCSNLAPPQAVACAQQMASRQALAAAELAQLQKTELPAVAELSDGESSRHAQEVCGQRCDPHEMLNPLLLNPPNPPLSPTRQSTAAPEGLPEHGTPMQSPLPSDQRIGADEPANRASPRSAPILPSIRAPAPDPVHGLSGGAAGQPPWVPLGALTGQKGPAFLQQLAAQAPLPGPRRTRQQRLAVTFARAKARLQAMQQVRAIPSFVF